MQFADGSVGNLTYCTVGSKTSGGERVEVFADGVGAATEDFARIDIRTSTRHTRSHWWPDKGYAQLISAFVAAIRSGGASPATVRDGSRATVGCLALLESAHGSRAVGHRPRRRPGTQGLMVVLQLGPYPPPHGGVQTNLVAIRDYLRARGIAAPVINLTRHRRHDTDDVYYPQSARQVWRLLSHIPADIIHVHIGGMLECPTSCVVCDVFAVATAASGPDVSFRRLSVEGCRRADASMVVASLRIQASRCGHRRERRDRDPVRAAGSGAVTHPSDLPVLSGRDPMRISPSPSHCTASARHTHPC